MFVSKKWRLNRSWKEHHGECLRRFFFKRKMCLEKKHQEVRMTNYTDWGEGTWFCCSVTHAQYAQTRIADTISIKISSARSFFFIKSSYPTQCCPAKALAWVTQIRSHVSVCQRIMKTPERLLTGHGKSSKANVCGNFLKEKNVVGEKANYTVRF